MVLSGRDLQWYVKNGKLKIDPISPEQFQQNGVDLILENAEHIHGEFYLGHTRETLELPDDLMALVNLRSTWAREGFSIPPTVVDAGFRGDLTLEILRSGNEVLLPIGQRFAHLIFIKMTSPSLPYRGKYDRQRGITKAR